MRNSHLILIDASGFAHRAYHVGSNQFRSDGLPTWAITGFMALMWKLLGAAQADAPTHAAACFDYPGKTFRHDIFPAYKTNRPARAMELSDQMPFMRHAADAMGIAPVELGGFEADDVIATLARMAVERGGRVSIISSDKDFCQLIQDGKVEVIDPVQNIRYREDDVRSKKFGVEPSQVPDYQALAGDAVDNIPGIDGVGHKTAAMLVRQFGNIEGVVEAAKARSHLIPAGARVKIRGALDELKLYRRLATLDRNAPITVDLDALETRPVMREHVEKILDKLEARGRFDQIFSTGAKMKRVVDPVTEPFEWWREECVVSGQRVPDVPQCGYYLGRLVRGGPLVPAGIWREPEIDFMTEKPTGLEILQCKIGGEARDPVLEWPALCKRPIKALEYEFQMADIAWTQLHAPLEPKANPLKPIDILKAPAPHCPPATVKKRKRA